MRRDREREMRGGLRQAGTVWMLLALCCHYSSAGDTSLPRLRLSYKELWGLNRSRLFHGSGEMPDIHTVLLDEYRDQLVVGGRDRLWSLSLDHVDQDSREIHWPSTERQRESCRLKGRDPMSECANFVRVLHSYNRSHLLACGTRAFDPACGFITLGRWPEDRVFKLESQQIGDGRYKCPYNPHKPCASTLVGGQLFIGLYGDFFGEDPAIFRSLDSHSVTRTEHDHRLLREPKFVAAQLIADNEDRDDDKVYFFFTEKALESDTGGGDTAIYSRVARLCANDVGGQRVLVNKWSTFLKARLICSVMGPNGVETHFDDMEDVFLLQTRDHRNPDVYILFRSTSNVFQGYAVCVYHMAAIREAFHGPFAHRRGPDYHWGAYEGKVPYPRPGTCAGQNNALPGAEYHSTKDYPDEVLRFIHSHPLMYQPVHPLHHKPLLMRTDGQQHLRQLVVDRVDAEDGRYDVLFIGTDAGLVLKIIVIYNRDAATMEEVLLEELQVFKVPTPIISMEISVKRQTLYIASSSVVAQVKIHQCDLYGSACTDCCLARDPYCAWDGDTCTRRFRRQDIQHGDVARQCQDLTNDEALPKPEERVLYGIKGNSTLLECSPRSPQAQVLWFVEGSYNTREEEVKTDERVIKTDLGLLLLNLHRLDGGMYFCKSREHGFTQTVARIRLHVLLEGQIEGLFHTGNEESLARRQPCVLQQGTQQGGSPWYKDFLQLLGYTHLQRVEEYCHKVWCSDKRRKKNRAAASKWKFSNVQERKVRSRDLADHRRSPRHVIDP
ncbi:semaphorin-3E isoform X2 [Amblyraja radiata]|uniref:semaphorin-3E isoform X2 n=1 Tax=Amblyraja radiata TaxID=386614 RepID=UPI001403090F|nr:semaphorin-3E isoform X2 [Amblyraja radiata]